MEIKAERKRILVIDDEENWVDLLDFELSERGYDVLTARRASEGLIALRENQVDLLITDIRMPGEMDGIDLVKIYRKDKPYLKVIFITGYTLDQDKLEKVLAHEYTRLLQKPFAIDELNKNVQELLSA